MEPLKTAQLFMNGRSQAVRLPKSFRFDGAEVQIRKVGNSVVLTPVQKDRWSAMEEALMAFEFEADFVLARPKPVPQKPRKKAFP